MGRRGRPPYPDILTPREWEVLALVREGLTNEAIAGRLGVTHAAAKYHVSEILSKLGVATREEAAAWQPAPERRPWGAADLGWLRPVPVGKAALIGTAMVVLAGLGVLAWASVRTVGNAQEFDLPWSYQQMLLDGQVLYLAPTDRSLWIADERLVAVAEIRVSSSVADAEELSADRTTAVIIDRVYVDEIRSEWVAGLLDRGVVVTAARMNVFDIPGVQWNDVPEVPDDVSPRDNFDFYDESRIYYTLYQREACEPLRRQGGAQDILDQRPVEDFRRFLVMLAKHHAHAQCGAESQS